MSKPEIDDLEAVRKVIDAVGTFDSADQERILRWSREKLGLPNQTAVAASAPASTTPPPGGGTGQEDRSRADIKSFIEGKNPQSNNQFAAAVAYYYRFEAPEHMRKESITSDDLQEACRQVGRDRLSRPGQTLVDAHGQGLLDRGERGTYTINTVGENLVAMTLPADAGRAPSRPAARVARKTTSRKSATPKRTARKTPTQKRS